MDELLAEFITETAEHLETVDVELVRLEQDPTDQKVLNNVFRLMHTIKGTCGFFGLSRLETVAHSTETVLDLFREGEREATPDAITTILAAIDRIKAIIAQLEAEADEPEGDDRALLASLSEIASETNSAEAASEPTADPDQAAALEMLDSAMSELTAARAMVDEPIPAEPVPAPVDDVMSPAPGQQTIRVNVDVLEDLMTMVSELVLTRNQLLRMVRDERQSEFHKPFQRLSVVATELQDGVMKARMQPLDAALSRLPRIVRDIAAEMGKSIELITEGEDTELDRQVLELIRDPLVHMIRNSCDHGLETPDERIAAGKPETGTIHLSATHEGGHIVIKVSDDGRGLDFDRIRSRAIRLGLIDETDVLSEQQISGFIFHPGFSTAKTVTSVSGRGVGMDVVRSNIEKIGGAVEISSTSGQGAVFTARIPLTLMIVSSLIVEVAEQKFALPQLNVSELVRLAGRASHRIDWVHGAPQLRLRDQLLPVIDLGHLLGVRDPIEEGSLNQSTTLAVMQAGAARYAVAFDRVIDPEEIVVKPLAPVLSGIPIFSGNTILGDGQVVMILDPNGLARSIGDRLGADDEQAIAAVVEADQKTLEEIVLFKTADGGLKGTRLSDISRLEQVRGEEITQSDQGHVLRYRDRLMPVLRLNGDTAPFAGTQPLIVFERDGKQLGLAVERILDIVEDPLEIDLAGQSEGISGIAIIDGQPADIVDSEYIIAQMNRLFRTGAEPLQ